MTCSNQVIPLIILALLVAVVACNTEMDEADPEVMELTGEDSEAIEAQDQAPASADDSIAIAESAAPPEISEEATILDAEGNVLREGTNQWTCVAVPGEPMCGDEQWLSWMDAFINQSDEVEVTALGISYMLQGDQGVSNIDPYAKEPTADNDWVTTGPHLMLIVPDPELLEGIPSDPESGGPYVMWRDTPLEHVMVPLEEDGVEMPYRESR